MIRGPRFSESGPAAFTLPLPEMASFPAPPPPEPEQLFEELLLPAAQRRKAVQKRREERGVEEEGGFVPPDATMLPDFSTSRKRARPVAPSELQRVLSHQKPGYRLKQLAALRARITDENWHAISPRDASVSAFVERIALGPRHGWKQAGTSSKGATCLTAFAYRPSV